MALDDFLKRFGLTFDRGRYKQQQNVGSRSEKKGSGFVSGTRSQWDALNKEMNRRR